MFIITLFRKTITRLAPIIPLVAVAQLSSFAFFNYNKKAPNNTDVIIAFNGDDQRISAACSLAEQGYAANLSATGTSAKELAQKTSQHGNLDNVILLEGGVRTPGGVRRLPDIRPYYNEMVKIWGSTLELTGQQLTNVLLNDLPLCNKTRQLIHRYFLFSV